ncbi:flavin reductase family protein [Streptomyces collinus]|uniref:Oxidoreductase n=1 Tax=Streptomyces collinus (strain DSM 40733 / Tue 365) TaxID=1214242 RepID=S5UJD8_STRC3|nr:flavin reductase family protein [Streptomyces collinus]AGS66938.1 oxidoreductase [Streptomyces collinus Tu 365]AGS73756.1 oxidoreductase [Streptomyces collinus Tu 365]
MGLPAPTATTLPPARGSAPQHAPRADRDTFCAAMTHLPSGVSIITTQSPQGPLGCTVNSVISLSAQPPTLLVSLANTSRTLLNALRTGGFAVNVVSWQQRELYGRFAQGDPVRRFDGVPHSLRDGQPVLTHASAVFTCAVERSIEVGDHTLLVGSPIDASHDGDARPLVLHRHRAHQLDASA